MSRSRSTVLTLVLLSHCLQCAVARAELPPAPEQPALARTGQPGGLRADDVAQRATATSLAAEAKLQEVAAARAQLGKAMADYVPRLNTSASAYRLSAIPAQPIGTVVFAPGAPAGALADGSPLVAAPLTVESMQHAISVNAQLVVPLSDYVFRLLQSQRAAEAQLDAAQQVLAATRRKADFDARALYYQWVSAELESEVAQQDLALGQQHLSRVQALAAADSASLADVARVEASVAGASFVLEKARNLAILQRERCGIAMHDPGARTYAIGDDFREPPAARGDLSDLSVLVQHAQATRPELQAMAAQRDAQQRLARVSRAQGIPRVDLIGQSTMANPNSRYFPPRDAYHGTWQAGAQLSFSPTDAITARKLATAAVAKARALEADRRALLDAVRAEVVEAVLAERNARAGLTSSDQRLRAAETSYRARYERFAAEKATLVELTEAQTELLHARLEAVQAHVAIRLAHARLDYVVGEPGRASALPRGQEGT